MTHKGFACAFCGRSINPGDEFTDCADCGAICCKPCAEAGVLETHECDYDDEE